MVHGTSLKHEMNLGLNFVLGMYTLWYIRYASHFNQAVGLSKIILNDLKSASMQDFASTAS